MKRRKRDRLARAYHQGFKAGVTGHSIQQCPHSEPQKRGFWLGGWREALAARHSGLFFS